MPQLQETSERQAALYRRAMSVLPGGVSRNTVLRQPHPLYVASGSGSRIVDIDGVELIDFSCNMASLIHGHAHPEIVKAVTEQLALGSAFTMATEAEVCFAELMCDRVPSVDKIRFVNSGTEAVMLAIKAARAFTGKPKIAKVEGAYHGVYDYAETSLNASPENWGPRDMPTSVATAAGTPVGALNDVVILPFNDAARARQILDQHTDSIACVLMDPLPHRAGLVPADANFLQDLYAWTRKNDSLFVYDEVISFRSAYGGAQAWYDLQPDLTAFGKIMGGGFPAGAVGGRESVMTVLDPTHEPLLLPHSGTFSANPITMIAGLTAMRLWDEQAVVRLNGLAERARVGIRQAIVDLQIKACVSGAGSMLRVHLRESVPDDYRAAYMDPTARQEIAWLCDFMLKKGFLMIYTGSAALSTAHTAEEVDAMVEAMGEGLRRLRERS